MTRVGAVTSRRRSCERLHGSLPGAAQARGETGGPVAQTRRRGAGRCRAGGIAAWLAKTGSRSHSATKASMPSRSRRPARASSSAARVGAGGRVGDARGRALEHEPAHRTRVRDGEAEGDPRTERVAEDVRRRGRQSLEDRREVVGGPLDAGARAGRRACRTGRARAGRRRSTPKAGDANAVACAPQPEPRPVKPWSSSSGTPVPRTRTSQRRPSTSIALIRASGRRRRRPPPRDAARRCGHGPSGSAGRGPRAHRSSRPAPRASRPS